MAMQPHTEAHISQPSWVPESSEGPRIEPQLSPWSKAPTLQLDKSANLNAFLEAKEDGNNRFVSVSSSAFVYYYQSVDPCCDELVSAPDFATNGRDSAPVVSTDAKLTIAVEVQIGIRPTQLPIGQSHNLHAIDQECRTEAADDASPDPPKHETAAAGPRNGAERVYETVQLPENDTASLAARHPIIALHWGIVE